MDYAEVVRTGNLQITRGRVFVWISAGTKQCVADVVKAAQLQLNHWP